MTLLKKIKSNELIMDPLIFLLPLGAFLAGFVDAIVGGGGLIQLPILMLALPFESMINILATNKVVSMSGTFLSAYRFSKHLEFNTRILLAAVFSAFFASLFGA